MPSSNVTMRAATTSPSDSSAGKSKEKTYVKHDYQDHYFDPFFDHIQAEESREEGSRRGPRGGVVEPFPSRLYQMLKHAEEEGYADIVSWSPHGRCFVIHKTQPFVEDVMPKYFRQSKLTSFKRQVNLYGFRRLTRGPDSGGYYHPLFLRGRPDLNRKIARTRVKGTGGKPSASPDTEPNFYAYPHCFEVNHAALPSSSQPHHGSSSQDPPATGVVYFPKPVPLAHGNQMMPDLIASRVGRKPDAVSSIAGPSHDITQDKTQLSTSQNFATHEHGRDKPGSMDMDCLTAVKIQKMKLALGSNVRAIADDMIRNSDRHAFQPSVACEAENQRFLHEKIQEICADPLFDSMCDTEFMETPSADVVVAAAAPVNDHPGPLQPPRSFQNFQNFRPISGPPDVLGNSHQYGREDQNITMDRSWPDDLANSLQAFPNEQFLPFHPEQARDLARPTPQRRNESYHDPFQDQIDQLMQDPGLAIADTSRNNFSMYETDMKSAVEWFCL